MTALVTVFLSFINSAYYGALLCNIHFSSDELKKGKVNEKLSIKFLVFGKGDDERSPTQSVY